MNQWYPLSKDALGRAQVDLEGDDIRVQLLRDTATYDAADEFLADLGSVTAGAPVALAGLALNDGALTTTDTEVSIASVTGADVRPWVLVQWTGDPATTRLLAWVDTDADAGVPFDVITPNGGAIILPISSPLARL